MITNSPGKENHTPPRQTRSAKKRIVALVDEDSVDYVPIQKPDSVKKVKLTDHQKEIFLAPRDKLPYMDEESIQIKSDLLQTRLGSQYDVESNEASISSFSNKAGAKEPASFEALHAEQKSKSVLASSNNSAEKKKRGRPKRSAETVSVPMKPASPNASPHKKEVASQPRKTGRFTRRSQAESAHKTEKVVEEKIAKKAETPAEIEKIPEPEERSADEDDEVVILETRSRRSLLKGTPTKYVPKTRNEKPVNKTGKKEKEEKKHKKGKKEDESDDDHLPISALVKKIPKVSEVLKEELEETTEPAIEAEKASEISIEIQKEEAPVVGVSKSVEEKKTEVVKTAEEQPLVIEAVPEEVVIFPPPTAVPEALQTPPRNTEIQIIVNPASITTPGILKTAATPTTQDRKTLHVHFDQDVAMKDDEQRTPKRKKIDCFFKKAEPRTDPLFPGLIGNTTPIAKIVHQLTPVSTHGAYKILQSRLASNKISTVGDLAASSEAFLSKVSIKLDTAKKALEEFSKTADGVQEAAFSPPLPFKTHEETTEVGPATVPREDNEEIGELKTLEGLSPKSPPQKIQKVEEGPKDSMELEKEAPVTEIPVIETQVELTPMKEPVEKAAEAVNELIEELVPVMKGTVEPATADDILPESAVSSEGASEGSEPLSEGTEALAVETAETLLVVAAESASVELDLMETTEPLTEPTKKPETVQEPVAEMGEFKPAEELIVEVEQPKPAKKPYNFKIFQIGLAALRKYVTDHAADFTQEENAEVVAGLADFFQEAQKNLQ